jgi:hypothetical protein
MASIAILVGGAVLNATAFVGGNYLAKFLSNDESPALAEKERHDKALEKYQQDYGRYQQRRQKILDWQAQSRERGSLAKQNFTDTDYALKLYNQTRPEQSLESMRAPELSDYYIPSKTQKNAELAYIGAGALAIGYTASRLL